MSYAIVCDACGATLQEMALPEYQMKMRTHETVDDKWWSISTPKGEWAIHVCDRDCLWEWVARTIEP